MMMKRGAIVIGVMLSTILAGCTAIHPPAPRLPGRLDVVASGESVTASGGQNIYALAKAHNVSMRDMIVLNNLQPPFTLKPGQILQLPAGGTGGVVGAVSANGMPGVLAAPTSSVDSSALAPASVPAMNESVQSQDLAPLPPAKTVPNIPTTATPSTIEPLKQGAKPTQVDVLNRPSPAPRTVTTTVTNAPQPSREVSSLPPATPKTAPMPAPVEMAKTTVDKPVDDAVATADAPNFVWPVQGPILSTYGSKGQGLTNDGINIGAPKGSPVVAAAGGMVVYAGNEMKGFGNLILIRHQGGWVTAYAHLDRIIATKDSIVAAGDMIATVGKTGNVPSAQLHFEARHNGKTVDPSKLISKP